MFSKDRERRERRGGGGYKIKGDSWSGNPEVMRGINACIQNNEVGCDRTNGAQSIHGIKCLDYDKELLHPNHSKITFLIVL